MDPKTIRAFGGDERESLMVKQDKSVYFSIPMLILVGLMVLSFVACTDPISTDTDLLITIVGKVTDSETGLPIGSANLKLYHNLKGGNEETLGTASTNSNGDYKLTGRHNCDRIPQVRAEADGYYPSNVSVYCQEQAQTKNFQLNPRS